MDKLQPVAWMQSKTTELTDGCECMQSVSFFKANDDDIPLYTHPVKEQSTNERIEMLKEMVEKIANPAGWIGYYEGKPATFLFKQEDVPRFLKNTDPVGSVIPLYTHPIKELTDEEIKELAMEYLENTGKGIVGVYDFVRAILQKANNG